MTFNAKERTLREIVVLALSAGWKVTKVTRAQGSLFGHILAVPIVIPPQPEENEPVTVVKVEKAGRDVVEPKGAVDVSQESTYEMPTFAFESSVDLSGVTVGVLLGVDLTSTSTSTSVVGVTGANGRVRMRDADTDTDGRKFIGHDGLLSPRSDGELRIGGGSRSESRGMNYSGGSGGHGPLPVEEEIFPR